jgi:hypothetical protein
VHHWYQRHHGINNIGSKFATGTAGVIDHRWQIIGTSELEETNLSLCNSTSQKCPNKIFKTFLIEEFFHLLLVSTTRVVHLELQISPPIFAKILKRP